MAALIEPAAIKAYKRLREDQMSRGLAYQLDLFTAKVRESSRFAASADVLKDLPPPVDPSGLSRTPRLRYQPPYPPGVFAIKTPPYSSGQPNPENAIRTAGTASGAFFNIEGFGDPVRGRLSVGVQGGWYRDDDWTGLTTYSELPDRWLLGDAISSSASILEVLDLPATLQSAATIVGDVQFGWDPMYPASAAAIGNFLNNAVACTPGLKDSALGGFVGVSAMAELTVSLVSGTEVLQTGQAFNNVLNLGVDAEFYGSEVQDKAPAPFLFNDFAFSSSPWGVVPLQASVPFAGGARQVLIETTIRLVGFRGGVNDPGAGSLTAAFQDLYEGASPVGYLPFAPNPFVVNRITIFAVP